MPWILVISVVRQPVLQPRPVVPLVLHPESMMPLICHSSLNLISWTHHSDHDQVSSPVIAFADFANVPQHSVGDMSRILLIVHPTMGGYLRSESA